MSLPDERQRFVADTRDYSGPLREAGRQADQFGDKNSKAALAARRMGVAAAEAADKAARAQKDAADAAEKLAKGEISADEAAQAEAKALREVERAAIKAAEAERANGKAADAAADQQRQLARDAELAGAAQRLASLRAAGAVKEHNSVLRDLESRFGDLSKEGNGAFQAIEKSGITAFDGLATSGPGTIAMVIAALAAVPFAALAAESAISLGLGGALAGIGLMATKSDSQVQAALHEMTSHIKSETKEIAAPFKQTWLEIAQAGTDAFDALAPELKADFAKLAPTLSAFVRNAGSAAAELAPGLHAATDAADALMDALGPRLPEITHNLSSSITIIANSAERSAPELANLAVSTSQLLPPLAHLLDLAVKVGPAVNLLFGAMTRGGGIFGMLTGGLKGNAGAADDASTALTTTGMATEHLLTSQKAASLTSDQLKKKLDELTGANQSAFDAQTNYANALNAANAQAKKSNAGFDGMSKAVQANRDALSNLAQTFKANLTGKTPQEVEKMRQEFIHVAEGMGASKQRAKELADELLGVSGNMKKIPSKKDTKLTATDSTKTGVASAKKNTSSFTRQAWRAALTADNKAGKAVSEATGLAKRFAHGTYRATLSAKNAVTSAFNSAMALGRSWERRVFTAVLNIRKLFASGGLVEGFADGGPVQHFPTGGQIHGPGTGTSDSIPIMASNGEYVVNAEATRKHKALLDAINFGLDGFVKGGGVGIGKLEQKQIDRLNAAKARVTLARARPEYLAAMAAQHALESMRKSVYGGMFLGGPSTVGSAHGSVVQHTTNLHVTVQGNVWETQSLAQALQGVFLRNGMSLAMPAGR